MGTLILPDLICNSPEIDSQNVLGYKNLEKKHFVLSRKYTNEYALRIVTE